MVPLLALYLASLGGLLASEVEPVGQKMVHRLAFVSGTSQPRPVAITNTSSSGVQKSVRLCEHLGGTVCAGVYCCLELRAVCCGTGETCCSAGYSCCDDHCCLRGSSCCGSGCCDDEDTCCDEGCCPGKSSCCGDACCPEKSHCCTNSAGASWCCPDGDQCHSAQGYCYTRRTTGAASLPSASAVMAVILASVASFKYFTEL